MSAPIASSSSNKPNKLIAKPSNPFANYSTAQSLGYEDPDAEPIAAQLELRRSQGVAGEWQIITPQAPTASSSLEPTTPSTAAVEADGDDSGLKREADAPPEEDSRSFKLRKKSLNPGLGEIYDPGLIPIKVKTKETHKPPLFTPDTPPSLPRWTSLQLKHPGPSQDAVSQDDSSLNGESALATTMEAGSSSSTPSSKWAKPQWSVPLPDIKLEERGKIFGLTEEPTDVIEETSTAEQRAELEVDPGIKTEDQPPLQPDPSNVFTASLFKKRKTPAGATKGRRQI
jgi:WW domain-binding protein 4